jgi:hypothetical protein
MAIIGALPFTITNGTPGNATQVQANYDKIVTDVNANAAEATFAATRAAAGANSDITSLSGLTTPLSPAQGGTIVYLGGTSTGSANAQVVSSLVPAGFALTTGLIVMFKAGFTNTGATTLNLAGTGVKNVYRAGKGLGIVALTNSQIEAGQMTIVSYDGTQYQLLNVAFS